MKPVQFGRRSPDKAVIDLSAAQERVLLASILEGRGQLVKSTQRKTFTGLVTLGVFQSFPALVTLAGYMEAARRGVTSTPVLRYLIDRARDSLLDCENPFIERRRRNLALLTALSYLEAALWFCQPYEMEADDLEQGLVAATARRISNPYALNDNLLEVMSLIAQGSLFYDDKPFEQLAERGLVIHDKAYCRGYLTAQGWLIAQERGMIPAVTYKSGELAMPGDRVKIGGVWRHVIAIRPGELRGEYYSTIGGVCQVWMAAHQCRLIQRGAAHNAAQDEQGRQIRAGDRVIDLTVDSRPVAKVYAIWQEFIHIKGAAINGVLLAQNTRRWNSRDRR